MMMPPGEVKEKDRGAIRKLWSVRIPGTSATTSQNRPEEQNPTWHGVLPTARTSTRVDILHH